MKQNDLIQGSPEWVEFRRRGIGASDANILMGDGFRSPRDLWLEKVGLGTPIVINQDMQRGIELEPRAREYLSKEAGVELKPAVFVHKQIPYMFASLDGWNEEQRLLVEIKCPRNGLHDEVPSYYYAQLQHQMEVVGVSMMMYMSFDGVNGKILSVKKDVDYTQKLLEAEREFWYKVENFIEIEDPNAYIKRSDKEYQDALRIYLHNKEHRQRWEGLENQAKDKLVQMSVKNSECMGYKISERVRQGSIDTKKLSKEENIDLNKYRREPVKYWEIRAIKQNGENNEYT